MSTGDGLTLAPGITQPSLRSRENPQSWNSAPWAPRIVPVASYCIKLPSVTLTASLFLVIGLVPETVAITRTLTQVDFSHLYELYSPYKIV